jgi:ankyrin repeat protein
MNDHDQLCEAIRSNDIERVKQIASRRIDLRRLCGDLDPLSLSIHCSESGLTDVVRVLLDSGASPNERSAYGRSPLYWATSRGELEFVEILVRAGAQVDAEEPDDGCTSLHLAAMKGYDDILAILLRTAREKQINKTDEFAFTPLAYAAWNGQISSVKMLLEAGADVNAHDESKIGDTALKFAVERRDDQMVRLLREYGADPNIPGWMGITATHVAQRLAADGSPQILSLL